MINHENNQERDHWAELAAELGLPPPTAPEPETPPPPATPGPSHRPPETPEVAMEADENWLPEALLAEQEEVLDSETDVDHGEPLKEVGPGDVAEKEVVAETEEVQPQRPRRGRHRGRRSGRKTSAVDEEESDRETDAAEEGRERRQRSRGRKRTRAASIAPAEEEESAESVVDTENDVDEDDLDTLSDWNVPSWTELIASLYRPDR